MIVKMVQRMGSGIIIEMTESEMRKEIEEGTKDAAERCGASPLTEDEMERLYDIYSSPVQVAGRDLLTVSQPLPLRRVSPSERRLLRT